MKIYYLTEVVKNIKALNESDQARVGRTRDFFEDYGFRIGPKYVKKVTASGIWELRAGRVRVFLYIKGDVAIGVHLIYKKTNKLPNRDIKLAERRSREL